MINKVIIVGHLGKDPVVRTLPSGGLVANLSVATNEVWKDRATGEKRTETQWHFVTVFGDGIVKVLQDYAAKGNRVYIEGFLKYRIYTDKDGVQKRLTEIVVGNNGVVRLLDFRKEDKKSDAVTADPFEGDPLDDELPDWP